MDPISIDDWFIKSNEFRVWLREECGRNLFEMQTSEGREIFEKEFVSQWNGSHLWAKYYKGINAAHMAIKVSRLIRTDREHMRCDRGLLSVGRRALGCWLGRRR